MARIVIKDGVTERTVELSDPVTVAGRSSENKIHIEDKQASRRHCQFEKTDFGVKLVDLESRNGTRVNEKVVNQALLRPGDKVEIGKHILLFEDPAFKEPPAEIAARFTPGAAAPLPPPAPLPAPAAAPGAAAGAAPEPRLRRRSGHTTSIERTARYQTAREKALLTKFGIGVGIFLFVIIALVMIPGGSTESPELAKARKEFAGGEKLYQEKRYDDALLVLERISPVHPEVYSQAQSIVRAIKAHQLKTTAPATEEERKAFDDVYEFCEKNRGNDRAAEQMLKKCEAFKMKFPRSAFVGTVDGYLKLAQEARRSAKVGEVGQEERLAGEEAKRHDYASAVKRLNALIAKATDDIEARQRLVALRDKILDQAKAYFDAEVARGQDHKSRGKKDEAIRTYEALIIAMGDAGVEELAGYCQVARTLLQGLR